MVVDYEDPLQVPKLCKTVEDKEKKGNVLAGVSAVLQHDAPEDSNILKTDENALLLHVDTHI